MKLSELRFIEILPQFMQQDPAVQGLAAGVDSIIREAAPIIENITTWSRVEHLPEADLDALAAEMNLLWYDSNAPTEVKRQIVKDGYATWQKLGSKWAVENFARTYLGECHVEEWFEYDGDPGHFRIITAAEITAAQQSKFFSLMHHVARASAKFDGFILEEGA